MDFTNDLIPLIMGGQKDSDNSGQSDSNEDSVNEKLMSMFTLSKFCKDLILLVMDKFPEEYKLSSKS